MSILAGEKKSTLDANQEHEQRLSGQRFGAHTIVNVPETKSSLSSARALVADFAQIAGAKGVLATVYVFAGALLESLGISLLVPLLGLLFSVSAVPPSSFGVAVMSTVSDGTRSAE